MFWGEKRRTCFKKVGSLFIATYLFKSILQKFLSLLMCIINGFSKYIRPTNNVCFDKRTKAFTGVLRKSFVCIDFYNKRQNFSVIRLTEFVFKKHQLIPKLYWRCVYLLRKISSTSPTYFKSTLCINSEYLSSFSALLIDHFELKTKMSV